MGCGPSKTLRVNVVKQSSFADEEAFGQPGEEMSPVVSNGLPKGYPISPGIKNGDFAFVKSTGSAKGRNVQKGIKLVPGPLVPPLQRTPSQIEFFRSLDDKINKGPDLDDCPEEWIDDHLAS